MLTAMSSIGENIRIERKAAGFKTQGAFAKALGLPQPRVSDWETDRYGPLELPNLLKIAKFLKLDVNRIVKGFDLEYDGVVTESLKAEPRTGALTPSAEPYGEEDLATAQTAIERAMADLAVVAKRLATRQAAMARRRGPGHAPHHRRSHQPHHHRRDEKTP